MAKQMFEKKEVLKLIGTVKCVAENEYIVIVRNGDLEEVYNLNEILDSIEGQVISLVSENF